MSKYAPLEKHLAQANHAQIHMNFSDIEKIIGQPLPPSARKHRAWWSNNPTNSVMTYAWLAAGYKTAEVNLEGEELLFIRDERASHVTANQKAHPLFGCLQGTVKVVDGHDLTQPADPSLAAWQPDLPNHAI